MIRPPAEPETSYLTELPPDVVTSLLVCHNEDVYDSEQPMEPD